MRRVVQSYGNGMSKSAKVLAEYLEVKRVRVTGSRFRPKIGDVVVNWGIPRNKLANVRYLNDLDAVRIASNKLSAFKKLKEANVRVPTFCTDSIDFKDWTTYYARQSLTGHSGEGIVVFENEGLSTNLPVSPPNAPLYVEAVEKKREYRVIVVGEEAVDRKQKKKKRDFEGERDENVWNCDNGYVFARNDCVWPDGLDSIGIAATKALGLTYGAVDIIEDNDGVLYVLEVNTAFGLEGQTISLVGDAIKGILETL